jgi:dUTP pyrophosphatase
MTLTLKVKRLTETAKLPTYAHDGDACFDLYADDVNDNFGGMYLCDTGLSVEVPQGYAMMIYSRSGHGFKNNMRLANCVGVLDSGYRGPIMIKLTCDRQIQYVPKVGDRIAQAMLIPVPTVTFEEVTELGDSERGEGGFGSSGR